MLTAKVMGNKRCHAISGAVLFYVLLPSFTKDTIFIFGESNEFKVKTKDYTNKIPFVK